MVFLTADFNFNDEEIPAMPEPIIIMFLTFYPFKINFNLKDLILIWKIFL